MQILLILLWFLMEQSPDGIVKEVSRMLDHQERKRNADAFRTEGVVPAYGIRNEILDREKMVLSFVTLGFDAWFTMDLAGYC